MRIVSDQGADALDQNPPALPRLPSGGRDRPGVRQLRHQRTQTHRGGGAARSEEARRGVQQTQVGVPGQHEPRNPHAAERHRRILGAAGRRKQARNPPGEYTDIILRNNTLLLQIISDVLDLARIESGRTDIERARSSTPGTYAGEVADSLRLQRRPGVELRVEEGLPEFPVTEYRKGLAQVLNNFTRNALKFTEKGSVTIGSAGFPATFYVRDTGIGIAPEDRERIFERFVKLDTTQGTGLGLSICKSIAEQLGGSVGVDFPAGEGSCFRIDIPAGE